MRPIQKLVLVIGVVVPVLVAQYGWQMFAGFTAAAPTKTPAPQATPSGISVAGARATVTPRPTPPGLPATLQPNGRAAAAETPPSDAVTPQSAQGVPAVPASGPAAQGVPDTGLGGDVAVVTREPAQTLPAVSATGPVVASTRTAVAAGASEPSQTVASFYQLVSSHQFDSAAQLWSPRMRAAYPPQENIDQRFSQTSSINLQRADVLSQDQTQASVAVDLVEALAPQGQRRYVGTWYLVRGPAGWMLDQPSLQSAP